MRHAYADKQLGIVLTFVALCMALVLSRQRITRRAARNESWLPDFSEKVVLFIITMQIIFTLKSNHTSIGGAPMAQPCRAHLGR